MVVSNVHAVSAAALSIHEFEANSSGSDFIYGEDRKGGATAKHGEASKERGNTDAVVDPEQPAGVRKMEAITMVWTKKWLIAAYALYVLPFKRGRAE